MADRHAVPEALKDVAAALYDKVSAYREQPNLEVEMRLCRFAVPCPSGRPVVLPRGATKGKLTVGTTQNHFGQIVEHLTATLVDEGHPAVVETTEDVQHRGTRYTYRFPHPSEADGEAEAATPVLVESLAKSRKLVEDIKLPLGVYDLRLSASVESPTPAESSAAAPQPPQPPPPPTVGPVVKGGGGYRRRKQRTSFHDGAYRYDCTIVEDSRGQRSFEVEVEAVFTDTKTELTLAWLEGLLGRMSALIAVCSAKRTRDDEDGGNIGDEARTREVERADTGV